MTIKPMLGSWEIPRIAHIETNEQRRYAEFSIPGKVGSLFQDLNTLPTRIVIAGSLYGSEARSGMLEEVRAKFQDGEALTFVADIVTATEIQYVIIERLHFEESGNVPDELRYFITLLESPPPPPPPNPLGALDTSLLDQAAGLVDTVTGALDIIDSLGNVPDFSNPTDSLSGALDGVDAATSGLDDVLGPLTDIFGSDDG